MENEQKYKDIKKEILSDSDDDSGESHDGSGSDSGSSSPGYLLLMDFIAASPFFVLKSCSFKSQFATTQSNVENLLTEHLCFYVALQVAFLLHAIVELFT